MGRAASARRRAPPTPSSDGDPTEVQVGSGTLWVSVPPGGVEVQVNHGGFSALVSGGAVMVDAGEGSDGLLLVTSGEALLVDAAGTSRMLTAGEAAVFGADGDLAGVDQVSEDELASDPWAAANRALDEQVVVVAPEVEAVAEAEPDEAPADEDEAEPESAEAMKRARRGRAGREEPEPVEEPDEPADEDEAEPPTKTSRSTRTSRTTRTPRTWRTRRTTAATRPPGSSRPSAVEVPDEQGELLDELYADAAAPAHEVSGRSVARVLEVAALIVFIAVIVLLVFLFNRDDDDTDPTEIANGVTTIQPTTTDPTTTTTEPSTTTTQLPVTVKISITACTQKGEALVASGRVEGAPESADGYRITVEVRLDDRTFGKKTVTVERGDNEQGRRDWKAEVPLNGDAVGAGAECKIPKGGVSLV